MNIAESVTVASRRSLEFKTVEMQFDDRDDVKIWIVNNQFGRRDLTPYERSLLALKIKPVIAKKAKKKQIRKPAESVLQKSAEQKPIDTRQELAKLAGVSHDTIAKVEKIEAHATPEVKAALKSGDLSINAAYEGIKSGAVTVEEVKQAKKLLMPCLKLKELGQT